MHHSPQVRVVGIFLAALALIGAPLFVALAHSQEAPSEEGLPKLGIPKALENRRPAGQGRELYRLVMMKAADDWRAYRFQVQTGKTWSLDNSKDPVWVWNKVTDHGALAEGDYDVQAVLLKGNGQKYERGVRIERQTGRAWFLEPGGWTDIEENSDFAQVTAPKNGFQLFIAASSSSWNAFRFNPDIGQAWEIPAERRVWNSIVDPVPIAAADYQLAVVNDVRPNDGTAKVLRIDPRSGRTWINLDGRWKLFGEAASFTGKGGPQSGYQLVLHAAASGWTIYRVNPETGSTWLPHTEGTNTTWRWIADRTGLTRGDYEVRVIDFVDDGRAQSGIVRMDRKSGRFWVCWNDQMWDDVLEQNDFASRAVPKQGYRLVTSSSDLNWYAVRFNPENGETWAPDQQGDDWIATRWIDVVGQPNGDYDVGVLSFVDGNRGTENVYRLDTRSGRAQVFNQRWQAIKSDGDMPPRLPPKPGYQLFLCRAPSACHPFQFDTETGAAWTPTPEQVMTWNKIADSDEPAKDSYLFDAVAWLGSDQASRTLALRMSRTNGRSWYVNGLNWVAIEQPK